MYKKKGIYFENYWSVKESVKIKIKALKTHTSTPNSRRKRKNKYADYQ